MEEFRKYLDVELRHIDYAPIAFVTAKDGTKVQGVLDLAGRPVQPGRTSTSAPAG